MDPKVLYWTAALVDLALVVLIAARGVAQVRRGEVARHRRSMQTCAALIGAFLLSYVVKLALLGREDLATWAPFYVHTLRFHETCVLAMLVAGALAFALARRMRGSRNVTRDASDPPADPKTLRWHRRAGWTGVVSAVAGLSSAAIVLFGMYARLSGA